MKAFKIYPFNLVAGGSQALLVEGSYVRVKTSTGDVQLSFDDVGPFGPLSSGQGKKGTPFKRILITDVTGNANNGTLIVADSDFVDDRITGEVSVVDGAKARVIANQVYGAAPLVPAGAGFLSVAQLWNPPGSGKRLNVSAVSMSGDQAASFFAGILLASIGGVDVSATRIRSNYSNAVASTAQARYLNTSAAAPITLIQWQGLGAAGIVTKHKPEQGPYVLEANSGLVVYSGTANLNMYVAFEYTEETPT